MYATLSGLKTNELPQALANCIASIALYGPSPSTLITGKSSNPSIHNAPPASSTLLRNVEERIIPPEEIAAAIVASISRNHQLNQWVNDYKLLKDGP
jgi:hypothetical protein